MFVDNVTLSLSAGKGGNGVIAWRREKFIPKGGPSGGDGGNGGSIFLTPTPQLFSLEDFRNQRIIKAENGRCGGSNNCKGRNGRDLFLKIPLGTVVRDKATLDILFDLTEPEMEQKICRGGKGGKGNTYFKSPTHQAPHKCTEGLDGETKEILLELKLIADIGLIGMPNAGKSTLISKITHLPVKIAPYPFTTLRPNIGLLQLEDFTRILIADIPGIIQGAHQNRGLGLSFLKHIERTSVLFYVIDLSGSEGRDPIQDFELLQRELKAYSENVMQKSFLVLLNKIDAEGALENEERFKKAYPYSQDTLLSISALTGEGLPQLREKIISMSGLMSTRNQSITY